MAIRRWFPAILLLTATTACDEAPEGDAPTLPAPGGGSKADDANGSSGDTSKLSAGVKDMLDRASAFVKVPPANGSCKDKCGSEDYIDGCYCDDECESKGDCCSDYAAACKEPQGTKGSCNNQCGNAGKQIDCYCVDGCEEDGDCCTDYESICVNGGGGDAGEPTSTGSCEGMCGESSTDGAGNVCWCDDECLDNGDCCSDYQAQCASGIAPDEPGPAGDLWTPAAPALSREACITFVKRKDLLDEILAAHEKKFIGLDTNCFAVGLYFAFGPGNYDHRGSVACIPETEPAGTVEAAIAYVREQRKELPICSSWSEFMAADYLDNPAFGITEFFEVE